MRKSDLQLDGQLREHLDERCGRFKCSINVSCMSVFYECPSGQGLLAYELEHMI